MTEDTEILEPDLPIVDPHHHFWDGPEGRYLIPELDRDLAGGHRVVGTLFVECSFRQQRDGPSEFWSLEETRAVALMARSSGGKRPYLGIIGFADLALGDSVEGILERHVEVAEGLLRGIRNVSAWDDDETLKHRRSNPPEGLLSSARFHEGFRLLARKGLAFDAWLYHTQIEELTALAHLFPETTIVLDHLGGPIGIGEYATRQEEEFQKWRSRIQRLAECQNVFVKLGGLGMGLQGTGVCHRSTAPTFRDLAALWGPYIETCIEIFGPDRAMFESNFPVDRRACSYVTLWNVFKHLTQGFSADERADLFGGSASRAYRLPADVRRHFSTIRHTAEIDQH